MVCICLDWSCFGHQCSLIFKENPDLWKPFVLWDLLLEGVLQFSPASFLFSDSTESEQTQQAEGLWWLAKAASSGLEGPFGRAEEHRWTLQSFCMYINCCGLSLLADGYSAGFLLEEREQLTDSLRGKVSALYLSNTEEVWVLLGGNASYCSHCENIWPQGCVIVNEHPFKNQAEFDNEAAC